MQHSRAPVGASSLSPAALGRVALSGPTPPLKQAGRASALSPQSSQGEGSRAPAALSPATPDDDAIAYEIAEEWENHLLELVEPKPAPRFRFLSIAELAATVPPKPLIGGVLFRSGFSAIVATYGAFKTFVALDLDLCIAHGLDWHGRDVTRGPVVYQAGEGGHGLYRRIEAWRTLNRLPDAGGIVFLPQSLKLNDARDLADFIAALRGLPDQPQKVTIDTFARSHRGNENSAEDTGLYVEAVDAIREATGAHVQLIHHAGWEGTRSRGSSNIPASLDTEITLTRDGDRVTLTCTKQKDAEPFAPITLEAVTVAGSLAFRALAPASPKLSDNERKVLGVVQGGDELSAKAWQQAACIPKRSFFAAKSRLLALAYVKPTRAGFTVTDSGRQAQ